MTARVRVRLVVAWGGAVFALGVLGLVLNLLAPADLSSRPGQVLYLCQAPVLATVGAFLAVRRPDNPVGVLALLGATGIGLDSPATGVLNLRVGGPDGALMRWSAVFDNTAWLISLAGLVLLLLLFPDGRFAGRWWRILGVVVAVDVGAVIVLGSVFVGVSENYPGVRLPLPGLVPRAALDAAFDTVLYPMIVAGILGGAVSLFVKARRARRRGDIVTAAQIRWLAWAAVLQALCSAAQSALAERGPVWAVASDVVSQLASFAVIGAIVVAITRYGLFEIDRILSRTVSYGVVTALLLAAYVGIIAGLSALLPTTVNAFVVAAATLAVAALFVPVRRTVQQRVDRRFNRARHDRAVLVEGFADGLRRGADPADLLAVVHRALEPAYADVWLVPR